MAILSIKKSTLKNLCSGNTETELPHFATLYTLANYLNFGINSITFSLYLAFLDHTDFGLVIYARLVGQFLDYLHLGFRFSIDKYSPRSSASFSFSLLTISFFCVSLFGGVVLFYSKCFLGFEPEFFSILVGSYILSILNVFKAHIRAVGNRWGQLLMMFFCYIAPSSINLILFFFNKTIETLNYYCVPFVFSLIIFLVIFLWFEKLKLRIRTISRVFKATADNSAINFVFMIVCLINVSFDRIYIENRYGRSELGVYSMQLFIFSIISFIPASLSEVVIRSFYIKDDSNPILIVKKNLLFIGVPTVMAVTVSLIFIPFVERFIPKFAGSELGAALCTLTAVPIAISGALTHHITALGLSRKLLFVSVSVLFFNFALYFISGHLFDSIIQVAGFVKFFSSVIELVMVLFILISAVGYLKFPILRHR